MEPSSGLSCSSRSLNRLVQSFIRNIIDRREVTKGTHFARAGKGGGGVGQLNQNKAWGNRLRSDDFY